MRMVGLVLLILANVGLHSIMESTPGTLLHYVSIGCVSAFLLFCYVAVLKLQAQIDEIKSRAE